MQEHHFIKVDGNEDILIISSRYTPYELVQTLKFSVEDKIVLEYLPSTLRVKYHYNDEIETIYEISGNKVNLFYGKLLSEIKSKVNASEWEYYIVEDASIKKHSI